jgi:hypothetical protein
VTRSPRLVEKKEAAAYCSIDEGTFDNWVRSGKMPAAWNGTKRWDMRAIDEALDKGSGLRAESPAGDEQSGTDFDDWLHEQ